VPDRRIVLIACAATLCCPRPAGAAETDDVRLAHFDEPIDVSDVPLGGWCQLIIDSAPIFVRRRTADQVSAMRRELLANLPDPARDEDRASIPEWLVVSGECTHAGCRVTAGLGDFQGWECLCHGSQFDLSGRVRRGPASRNLGVIHYEMNRPQQLVLRAT
jgi:ubiquinol-cytochrome c reductase iron-sulfur subunit